MLETPNFRNLFQINRYAKGKPSIFRNQKKRMFVNRQFMTIIEKFHVLQTISSKY